MGGGCTAAGEAVAHAAATARGPTTAAAAGGATRSAVLPRGVRGAPPPLAGYVSAGGSGPPPQAPATYARSGSRARRDGPPLGPCARCCLDMTRAYAWTSCRRCGCVAASTLPPLCRAPRPLPGTSHPCTSPSHPSRPVAQPLFATAVGCASPGLPPPQRSPPSPSPPPAWPSTLRAREKRVRALGGSSTVWCCDQRR